MYHNVTKNNKQNFINQMNEILKLGQPISLGKFNSDAASPPFLISVTFDDGYQSVYDNAIPILIEKQIPATIFVTTGYLGKKPGWINNENHEYDNELIMTKEQLKQIPFDLIKLGSHCVTHPQLTELKDNEIMKELQESKNILENISQNSINQFSFPYGSYNNKIINLLQKSGYKYVLLNVPYYDKFKHGNYIIGRISISLDDWLIEYRFKLLGAYQWLAFVSYFKKKMLAWFIHKNLVSCGISDRCTSSFTD